eukprot:8286629-Lingulodinium_polyedra.AAC.1
MAVDAWRAHIGKCVAPRQWNAFPNACLSGCRVRAAHGCIQKCIPLLRRCVFRDSRSMRQPPRGGRRM